MTETPSRNQLNDIVAAWIAADLDRPLIEPTKRALARYAEIGEQVRAMRTDNGWKELSAQVAAGEIELRDAVIEFSALKMATASITGMPSLVVISDRARRIVLANAVAAAAAAEGDLIGHIALKRADISAELTKLNALLKGIADATAAIEAGSKEAKAWARREELAARLRSLRECSKTLERAGLVGEIEKPAARAEASEEASRSKRRQGVKWQKDGVYSDGTPREVPVL